MRRLLSPPVAAPLLPLLLILTLPAACKRAEESSSEGAAPEEASSPVGPVFESGVASMYSDKLAGRPTASGEPYDPKKMTCAHKKLRLGTVVEVERLSNGRKVRCVVNDRGPFHKKRIIDLSRATAEALEIDGIAQVKLRKVESEKPSTPDQES